ncbi:MAG: adenylyltransferase/cytidyltransferase family protein [Candidatus Aenigmatarchaeota archaeon]
MKKKRVLVGGTFNVLHPGHIFFLKKAKMLGDELIVVLANDKTARKNGKLFSPASERKRLLSSLKFVDKVVIGAWPKNEEKFVKKFKPDIIAIGYDQKIGPGLKKLKNVRIVRIRKYGNYSSRKIIK